MTAKVDEKTILTLLEDKDVVTDDGAMRLVLDEMEDPEAFVAQHQDDDNFLIRKRMQQISYQLYHRRVYDEFVSGFRSKKMSFWDGIFKMSILSDGRINDDFLQQMVDKYFGIILGDFQPGTKLTTKELLKLVNESQLHVPHGFDFFQLFNLFLPDIFEDGGACHPLVLCEIVRQMGIRVGWYASIVIFNGMYMLNTPEGKIISPDREWNVLSSVTDRQCHTCSNEELLKIYLCLVHVMSIVSRRPIGVYYSSKLLSDVMRTKMKDMVYPIGIVKNFKTKS
ncbi:MAG: hypothetical protein J6X55_05320 [Victivallales bacterium]|nr:hypothetical protein [Victivallales bacterium]